jgi:Ca2+-binding RTX toxin-like protein
VHAASAGCTRVGDYRVDCNASGITLIQASSGDQTDKITNNANLASILNGGAAADVLTGGSTHDVITGGTGADVMIGMNGNDSIRGRDLTDDTTINCDGGTVSGLNDSADLDLLPKDSPATGCENVTRH